MDAEHRHELKTNELAKWINNFPQWVKKNTKVLIYAAVVIALVAGSYLYHHRKVKTVSEKKLAFTQLATALPQTKSRILQAQSQGIDLSYNLLTVADDMGKAAQQADNPDMAAMAYIKAADGLRMELHYRMSNLTRQDIETQIAQAKQNYEQAIEKAHENPSLKALAKFGLGICEEEIGNFDAARQIYKEIFEAPQLEGTVGASAAKTRYDIMGDFKEKISFWPAPVIDPNAPTPVLFDANDINLPTLEITEPNL